MPQDSYADTLDLIDRTPYGKAIMAPFIQEIVSGGLAKGDNITSTQGPVAYCCVVLTPAGRDRLTESKKSWLQKAVDKQPITMIQVVVTAVLTIASYFLGRWHTP